MTRGAVLLKEDSSLPGVTHRRDLSCGLSTNTGTGNGDAQKERPGE